MASRYEQAPLLDRVIHAAELQFGQRSRVTGTNDRYLALLLLLQRCRLLRSRGIHPTSFSFGSSSGGCGDGSHDGDGEMYVCRYPNERHWGAEVSQSLIRIVKFYIL
jgi:hypothetical protein